MKTMCGGNVIDYNLQGTPSFRLGFGNRTRTRDDLIVFMAYTFSGLPCGEGPCESTCESTWERTFKTLWMICWQFCNMVVMYNASFEELQFFKISGSSLSLYSYIHFPSHYMALDSL